MYKNILCAIDGSNPAKKALTSAAEIAQMSRAELTVLYVEPLPMLNLLAFYPPTMMKEEVLPEEVLQRLEAQGKNIIAEASQLLDSFGIKYEARIIPGHPAHTITEILQEGNHDLLVIGSRGWGELKGILLGSISHQLVHTSPCPVLVVK